jgi:hypothetical protein
VKREAEEAQARLAATQEAGQRRLANFEGAWAAESIGVNLTGMEFYKKT